jgi:hypothetical protein
MTFHLWSILSVALNLSYRKISEDFYQMILVDSLFSFTSTTIKQLLGQKQGDMVEKWAEKSSWCFSEKKLGKKLHVNPHHSMRVERSVRPAVLVPLHSELYLQHKLLFKNLNHKNCTSYKMLFADSSHQSGLLLPYPTATVPFPCWGTYPTSQHTLPETPFSCHPIHQSLPMCPLAIIK